MRRRFIIGIAVLTFAATACVKQNKPGVAIKSLQSNIVFGINPPAPVVGPAIVSGNGDLLPPTTPVSPTVFPQIPRPPQLLCRQATNNDTAGAPATVDVPGVPTVGTYRWHEAGNVTIAGVKIDIPPLFIQRKVLDVSPVTTMTTPVGGDTPTAPNTTRTFTYRVRTDLNQLSAGGTNSSGYEIDTYQVKDHPLSIGAGPSSANIGKPIAVGDPERGLALLKSEIYDPGGHLTGTFAPSTGLLLLPLSVNGGEDFQSVAVDPTTGQVEILDGTVGARKLIDACGDLVQGWTVTTRMFYGIPDAANANAGFGAVNDTYVVATQLGAMIVDDTIGPFDNQVPVPALPLPGLPHVPGAPDNLGQIPALPVTLPTTGNTIHLTLAQLHPSPL